MLSLKSYLQKKSWENTFKGNFCRYLNNTLNIGQFQLRGCCFGLRWCCTERHKTLKFWILVPIRTLKHKAAAQLQFYQVLKVQSRDNNMVVITAHTHKLTQLKTSSSESNPHVKNCCKYKIDSLLLLISPGLFSTVGPEWQIVLKPPSSLFSFSLCDNTYRSTVSKSIF